MTFNTANPLDPKLIQAPSSFLRNLLSEINDDTQTQEPPRVSNYSKNASKKLKRYLIVGCGWAGKTIASEIIKKGRGQVVGFVDDNHLSKTISVDGGDGSIKIPVVGHSKNLLKLFKDRKADSIIISVTHDREDHLLRQIVQCYESRVPVLEMPDLYAQLTKKIPIKHLTHHWIIPNMTTPVTNVYSFFHGAMNMFFSLLLFLFALLPLFPIIYLLIKMDSPGPVFYRQKRVGKNGENFYLLKFRTMTVNADKMGEKWTKKKDNRITRVGHWLRKYRIDELPQLINIFKGEMALIGPRPEAVELVEEFTQAIPFYQYRYLVKPGITGWAQVNYENTCSVDGALEKLQYDLFWIKNRSIWLDLLISFKSAKVMITGFGTS